MFSQGQYLLHISVFCKQKYAVTVFRSSLDQWWQWPSLDFPPTAETSHCTPLWVYSENIYPYKHPFVHSQGIFWWANPNTGYTAAGTSAQCMSKKHPLSLFLWFYICFYDPFYISEALIMNHNTKDRKVKIGIFIISGRKKENKLALLVWEGYLFVM